MIVLYTSPKTKRTTRMQTNLESQIAAHIRRVLIFTKGNKKEAAKLLGMSRTALYTHLSSVPKANMGNPD